MPDFSDRPVDLELPVVATALTWMAIHGYLCLGLRHPGTQGAGHPSHAMVRDFVEQLGEHLVDIGLMTADEVSMVQRVEAEEQPSCEVCQCTDVEACPGGCGWDPGYARAGRAVCTRCVDLATPTVSHILTPGDPGYHDVMRGLGGR